ncbi:MAG: hypothetical protein RIQ93_1287 [Verrucomicrobiota bacterium]|jgi:hypothetical protein
MKAKQSHHMLLFASGAVAVASALVFGLMAWRGAGAVAPISTSGAIAAAPYVPSKVEVSSFASDPWNPPTAQARGREWVYDLFTPPEIYYNGRSKQFTVKPPAGFGDDAPTEPFGLELDAVRPEPFRLQLIGYMGAEGNWRGTFENLQTGEVFLATAGRRVANLALTIRALDVRERPVALPQGMTTRQRVASAVVFDERSGREVTITHRERHFTDTLFAVVLPSDASAAREVRTGEVFKVGNVTYRIEKITLSPPSIEVTKEAPGRAQPERRTLTPQEHEPGENAPPAS